MPLIWTFVTEKSFLAQSGSQFCWWETEGPWCSVKMTIAFSVDEAKEEKWRFRNAGNLFGAATISDAQFYSVKIDSWIETKETLLLPVFITLHEFPLEMCHFQFKKRVCNTIRKEFVLGNCGVARKSQWIQDHYTWAEVDSAILCCNVFTCRRISIWSG